MKSLLLLVASVLFFSSTQADQVQLKRSKEASCKASINFPNYRNQIASLAWVSELRYLNDEQEVELSVNYVHLKCDNESSQFVRQEIPSDALVTVIRNPEEFSGAVLSGSRVHQSQSIILSEMETDELRKLLQSILGSAQLDLKTTRMDRAALIREINWQVDRDRSDSPSDGSIIHFEKVSIRAPLKALMSDLEIEMWRSGDQVSLDLLLTFEIFPKTSSVTPFYVPYILALGLN